MSWQLCTISAFVAVGIACLIGIVAKEVRKGPGNKRTGLPPPSEACRRAPDYRNYEPLSPRRYIP